MRVSRPGCLGGDCRLRPARSRSLAALVLSLCLADTGGHVLAQQGPATSFVYDSNGNVTSKTEAGGGRTYIYDSSSLLREVQPRLS